MALFIAQGQYNRRRAGISVAIAMSVLIPVLICGVCFILHLREIGYNQRLKEDSSKVRNVSEHKNNAVLSWVIELTGISREIFVALQI